MSSAAIATDFLEPPREEGEIGRLGPYRVVGLLGRGGMGQVYRAEDTRLQRTVALKVMNKRFAATPHARQRFIDEARSMAAVHHDNVATIFEVGQKDNTPFMAMELLQGQTLEQAVAGGRRFSMEEVISIAEQTASGLNAAHAQGITHRDIKPANLWIQEPSNRIKILDFGLALAGSGIDQLSEVGSVIGTPGYLAPEQARNEPVDARTDLYALGVVLYELVAGRLPLVAPNVALHLVTIICHHPPPVSQVAPTVPAPLADLIMRLLAKEPRDRIPTAEQLQVDLKRVRDEIANAQSQSLEIVVAPEDSRTRRVKNMAGEMPVDRESNRPKPRGFSIGQWVSSAAIALLLVFGGYLALQPKRVAQAPMANPNPRPQPPKVVLAKDLTALVLEDAVTGNREVPVGQIARFQVQLTNQAISSANDPRVKHPSAKQVAKFVTFLKREAGPKQPTKSYPLPMSPSSLPAPGETKTVDLQFSTQQLPLSEYELLVELQAPGGAIVDTAKTQFRVSENLLQSELLGFEIVRTLDGSGADTSLAEGAADTLAKKPAIELHGGKSKRSIGVIRFDLRKLLGDPASQNVSNIDRTVLLLTVAKDSFQSRSELKVYGWPNDLEGQSPSADLWQESGESALLWANSPTLKGIESLSFLDELEVDNESNVLKEKPDQVRFASSRLDDFIRSQGNGLITLVLVQELPNDKTTRLVAREASRPEQVPGLAIRFRPAGEQL